MHLGIIAATLVLNTVGQPKMADPFSFHSAQRVYQWFIAPGGGVCPMPTMFVVMVPLTKADMAKLPKSAKARQELHIIIETDSVAKTQSLTHALIESVRQVVGESEATETSRALEKTSKVDCRGTKSDPKTVIDPVVTGF